MSHLHPSAARAILMFFLHKFTCLVCFGSIVITFGVAQAQDIAKMRVFTDEKKRFSLKLPYDWQIKPDPVMALSASRQKHGPNDVFQENVKVVVAQLAKGIDLTTYFNNSMTTYQSIWTIHEKKNVTLSRQPAIRTIITQRIGKTETKLLKYWLTSGGQIFIITFAANPAHFNTYLPTFETIANSFEIMGEKRTHYSDGIACSELSPMEWLKSDEYIPPISDKEIPIEGLLKSIKGTVLLTGQKPILLLSTFLNPPPIDPVPGDVLRL